MRSRQVAPEIEWLYSLQSFGIKLGLENTHALLRLLDHPERRYSSVLVGGTNGKGSVAAMLHSMLEASGIASGLFTSPHLVRPNERIRIGARDIGTEDLLRNLRRVRGMIDCGLSRDELTAHPSFFEVTAAVALEAFREAGVQVAVLEVGLGGRLDATNAAPADVSVVVSVDLDHTEILGPTIERIATEKAGIIKPGRPVVSGVARQQAWSVLQRTCRDRRARLVDARLATRLVAEEPGGLSFQTAEGVYPNLRLGLAGRHQIDNARVALCAFEHAVRSLNRRPQSDAVRAGLGAVRWPGRLQWIEDAGARTPLLLDGAHNPAGARALARHVRDLDRGRPVLLFGAMRDKQASAMLDLLGPLSRAAVLTRPPVARAADPVDLLPEAARSLTRVEVREDPESALELAREIAGSDGFVLVTGSLYLVGEILGSLEDRAAPGPVSM